MPNFLSPDAAAELLVRTARGLAQRGWTPATAGNFSARLGSETFLVTASGHDKGNLTPGNFLTVHIDGRVLSGAGKPSAETPLHALLYGCSAEIGAVLHTHSRTQTLAAGLLAQHNDGTRRIRFSGYELQKAFAGVETHEGHIDLPVFDNAQDMPALARDINGKLGGANTAPGFLLDSHGIYAWGRDIAQAQRHLEALEFLLDCELERRRHAP